MIVVRIWEGLGNQMFQYAFAKALQLRQGVNVCLDYDSQINRASDQKRTPRDYQLSNFRITLDTSVNIQNQYFFLDGRTAFNRSIKSLAQKSLYPYKYYEEKDEAFKPELLDIKGNCYIWGWFQNQKYFIEYENVIRKEFHLKEKIRIDKQLRDILVKENTVAVHIRRGDYKKSNNILPLLYYERAFKYIKDRVEKPVFCVFSDEIDWVKRNLMIEGEYYFVNESHTLTDCEELIVMSHCKHDIIANSTYSWWGAWLNNFEKKIVIGPRKWFLHSKAEYDIMPDNWIKI